MTKKILVILSVFLILIVGGMLVYTYIFRDAEKSVQSSTAEINISSADLLQAYESNEQKANGLYLDKIIQVAGRIDSIIDDGSYITLTLKDADDMAGVLCSFDKTAWNVGSLNVGDPIVIKGQCTGYLLDVVLVKCAIVSNQ